MSSAWTRFVIISCAKRSLARTEFSYDALVQRYNSDLANGLGNLASRTAAMIEKNSGGKIPKPPRFNRRTRHLPQERKK